MRVPFPPFPSVSGITWTWRPVVLAMLGCFCFLSPLHGVHYFIDEVMTGNARLRVQCRDRSMVNALGFYGARCARLVDSVLGLNTTVYRKIWILELVEGGETGEDAGDQLLVTYRIGEEEIVFADRLFRTLLRRRLEGVMGRDVRPGPFFDLVVAGLCHRYVRGRHALSGYYEPDYGIAREQFLRGDYPRLPILLRTSIPLTYRFFHELFMMHGDLLVLGLEGLTGNRHGAVVLGLLRAEQRRKDVLAEFEELTRRHWHKDETAQGFYERTVNRVSRRRGYLTGEDVIAERVKELETVSVLSYEGGTAVRRVALEEMPDVLEDYRTDVQGVLRLENRFRSLCQASPYLLRSSLDAYARAISWIREGDLKRFRKEIVAARESFGQALKRQRALNAYVDEYESKHVPALHRFVDFVEIIKHYRELSNTLYPRELFKKFEE